MAFCGNCGNEMSDGSKFCNNCGASVGGHFAAGAGSNISPINAVSAGKSTGNVPNDGNGNNKKPNTLLIVGIIVVAMLMIFILAMSASSKKHNKKNDKEINKVESEAGNSGEALENDESVSDGGDSNGGAPKSEVDGKTNVENKEDNKSKFVKAGYSEIEFAGIVFEISNEYDATYSINDVEMEANHGNSIIFFESSSLGGATLTNDLFERKIDVIDESITTSIEGCGIDNAKIINYEFTKTAGFKTRKMDFIGMYNNEHIDGTVLTINNTDNGELILILYATGELYKDDSNDDFDRMITTAHPAGSSGSSESIKDNSKDNTETKSNDSSSDSKAVDPSLKAFLDSYEEFVDEYVDFMKGYMADPGNVLSMMKEYTEIMSKYEKFMKEVDKYNSDDMSPADLAYYLEVTSRCTQKMLEIY